MTSVGGYDEAPLIYSGRSATDWVTLAVSRGPQRVYHTPRQRRIVSRWLVLDVIVIGPNWDHDVGCYACW